MQSRVVSYRNSTSNHNRPRIHEKRPRVVSYRNSTSNHNFSSAALRSFTVVSYRNSTSNHNFACSVIIGSLLYLIEILHQTTTHAFVLVRKQRCILSKFYIKPQQRIRHKVGHSVVSYRNSTSNHNISILRSVSITVVSYRNSTSNHNSSAVSMSGVQVVSYRNSTSNHNVGPHID